MGYKCKTYGRNKKNVFIFEEALFTKKIKRFPVFCTGRTLMDKYVPADDLQGEPENRAKSDRMTCIHLMTGKQFLSKHQQR